MTLFSRLLGWRTSAQRAPAQRPGSVAGAEAMFRDERGPTLPKQRQSRGGGLFSSDVFLDSYEYYRRYPDVASSSVSARDHFLDRGEAEGRLAGDRLDPEAYLRRYPDVAAFVPGPLTHWLRHGCLEPLVFNPTPADATLVAGDRLREAMFPSPNEAANPATLWFDDMRWGALASAAAAPAWIGRDRMPDAMRWLPSETHGDDWTAGRGERLHLDRMGIRDPVSTLSLVPPLHRTGPTPPSEAFSLHIISVVSSADPLLDLCMAGVERAVRLAGLHADDVRWTLLVADREERRLVKAALPDVVRRFASVRVGAGTAFELRLAARTERMSWVLPLAPGQILLREALAVLAHYAEVAGAALIATPPVLLDDEGRVLAYGRYDRAPAAVLGFNAQRSLRCWRQSLMQVDGSEGLFEQDHAWLRLADEDVCAPSEHLHLQRASLHPIETGRLIAAAADELDRRFGPVVRGEGFRDAEIGCLIATDGADADVVRETTGAVEAAGDRLRAISAFGSLPDMPALLAVIPAGARLAPAFTELARAQAASGAEVVFGRTVVRSANGSLTRGPELVPPIAMLEGARIPAAACLFTRDCLDRIGPDAIARLLRAGDAAPTILIEAANHWLAVDICVTEISDAGAGQESVDPPILDLSRERLLRLSRFSQTLLNRIDPALIERLRARLDCHG